MRPAAPRIRLRLTIWYAGSVLLLLLGATFATRELLHDALDREFNASLRASAGLVRGFFRAELREYREVQATLHHITSELVFADRHLVFITSGGERFQLADSVRPRVEVPLEPPLQVLEVPLDEELAPGWKMRLAVSAAPLERHRREVDEGALLAIPIAAIVATLIGWGIAGRTLRPLKLMAAATERITAARTGERLPVVDADDEMGRLGLRFNALLDRLDEALGQQRRFLAEAAHELRTPIARARTGAEAALAGTDVAAHREALAQVQRELVDMTKLIDELLQLARADADVRTAVHEAGFLDDVVSDALAAWQPVAVEAGVTLESTRLEETPATIDATLVARLVGILVDNALRYTPRGGRVDVRVCPSPDGAVLEVEDTGIGMTDEERARVGERFFRGARARAMAPAGSGLGLAIAAWVAAQHGATLRFEGSAPHGTRAVVTIPPGGARR